MREKSGLFKNTNPSKENWISGFFGYPGVAVNCVANFNEARVELELYHSDKVRNKQLYDFLYSHREEIEKQLARKPVWSRADELKASRIYYVAENVDISNEIDWPRMAEFHIQMTITLRKVFLPLLKEYFEEFRK